jgi:hypothetical protein
MTEKENDGDSWFSKYGPYVIAIGLFIFLLCLYFFGGADALNFFLDPFGDMYMGSPSRPVYNLKTAFGIVN